MDVLSLVLAIPSWFIVLALTVAGVYTYFTWHRGYWEKQGVKTPKSWSIFGSFDSRGKKHIMELDRENYTKLGRVYGLYDGRIPTLHIGDPDLIKQVTVKDFWAFPFSRNLKIANDPIGSKFLTNLRGDEWKMIRNVMSPTFTSGKLKMMSHLIEESCKTLVENLNKYAESGEPFDARKIMSAYTMDVIALCAFGTKIESMSNPDNIFVSHARKVFGVNMSWKILLLVFFPRLANLLNINTIFPQDSLLFFKSIVDRVIEMRKHEKDSPRDFLALLLEAQIDETEEQESKPQLNGETEADPAKKKRVLSSDLITSQSVLFLLAGYETTATLLGFCFYLLARNPDVQDKLSEEVKTITSKHEDKINYQTVAEMPYVDMVVSEALRIYPPGARTERTCVEEGFDLGGIILKEGTVIGIPIYSIHHDPEFYPDPEKFDPERFTPEKKADRNPFTYLPFGAGPRNCIASRFALMETKMTLASVIKEFSIKACPQTEEKLEFFAGAGVLQPKSLTVVLEKRAKN